MVCGGWHAASGGLVVLGGSGWFRVVPDVAFCESILTRWGVEVLVLSVSVFVLPGL